MDKEIKVAVCWIVKDSDDEALLIEQSILSVWQFVDGIFVNRNAKHGQKRSEKLTAVLNNYRVDTIETEWHDNFAEARNANFAQVPDDYTHILWLDADDTVDKPEKIKAVLKEAPRQDSIYVEYLYDRDEVGNAITTHMVARIVKNNGSHVWKGMIHETLVETRGAFQGMTKDFTILHHATAERTQQSYDRNITLLEKQLASEDSVDPRTLYYLGSTYIDAGRSEDAKELLTTYLTLSGWDQERAVAETKLGRLYLADGNHMEAKKHFMLAIGEDPENPEPRVEMGSLELEVQNYQKARRWLEPVLTMETSSTTLEINPMTNTFRTYLLLADVYLNMGGKWLEKSLEFAQKALKYKKKDKHIKKYVNHIKDIVRDKQLLTNFLELAKQLEKNKEYDKAALLVESVPKQLDDNPLIVRMRNKNAAKWPEKSIAIFTGDTAIDNWGPWSLKDGIGGSEEAVIRLAPKLRDLGYKVVVFGKPGNSPGDYEGIMWRNFWECNLEDEFDIFIGWRAPHLFDANIKARKKYLWLHDVIEVGEFTKERIDNFDKCIVLSEYHRSLFPMIPDEKILLSGNGIDPEDFAQYDGKIVRDAHKVIYASSHTRGLTYLYDIWPDVIKAVPDATLDVYYGRESYDAINKGNPERLHWMDSMEAKAKTLPGVIDHGKVDQDKIVQQCFKSGIWAYPCHFPEISCITALKSQASGAVPVSSNFGALEETVQFGEKQDIGEFTDEDIEDYKQRLIWWLQHPKQQEDVRPEMMKWARTKSWKAIAEQWVGDFEYAKAK